MKTIKITILVIISIVIIMITFLFALIYFGGDPISNKKTSHICRILSIECIADSSFLRIKEKYSVDFVRDPTWLGALASFENMPFPSEILYFIEYPIELIGLDSQFGSIRYIYNPDISDHVLSGLSIELSELEKKRIQQRIQKVYYQYECEEGKKNLQEWK